MICFEIAVPSWRHIEIIESTKPWDPRWLLWHLKWRQIPMVVIDMGIPINPTRHLTAPSRTYRSRKILTWRWRNTLTRRIRGERGKDRKRRSVFDVSTVQGNVQLHAISHLISWELTYPLSRAFWRWFSFSTGGICLFPVGYSFRQIVPLKVWFVRTPHWRSNKFSTLILVVDVIGSRFLFSLSFIWVLLNGTYIWNTCRKYWENL